MPGRHDRQRPEGADGLSVALTKMRRPSGCILADATARHSHVPSGVSVLRIKKDGYWPLLRVSAAAWTRVSNTLGVDDQPSLGFASVFPDGYRARESRTNAGRHGFVVPGWTDVVDESRSSFASSLLAASRSPTASTRNLSMPAVTGARTCGSTRFVDDGGRTVLRRSDGSICRRYGSTGPEHMGRRRVPRR